MKHSLGTEIIYLNNRYQEVSKYYARFLVETGRVSPDRIIVYKRYPLLRVLAFVNRDK